ncbi:MAG TPA: cytochrome c1 [Aliidongia sp.]|nr:cytochrome c1 [Aliidongia sp.]
MIRRLFLAAALAALPLVSVPALAEDETPLLQGHFSFEGPFGTLDRAAAQRGLQIYKEVCSNCHGLYELSYRNLSELGYNDDEVKAFAAQSNVTEISDDTGKPAERPARPYDKFVRPFPNDIVARLSNNGALPPDLALIVKAREGGADYLYSLMQGYGDAPAGVKLGENLNYNKYFKGHQIAMPQPLTDGAVTFADGAPNTLKDEAYDVATFLEWASEPEADQRKQIGWKVVIFLVVTTVVLYIVKRKIWSDVEH